MFENGVVLEVTQTQAFSSSPTCPFENGVVLEVTQTLKPASNMILSFENGVVLEVTQTRVGHNAKDCQV